MIGSSDISLKTVAEVLGESNRSLKTVCKSDNVNKWSWHKPINADTVLFGITDEDIADYNDGLEFGVHVQSGIYASVANGGELQRTAIGDTNLRLGDFRGYDHEQGCWWNMENTSEDDVVDGYGIINTKNDSLTIKWENGNWLGKIATLKWKSAIAPSDTTNGVFSWGFLLCKDANVYPDAETTARLYYNAGAVNSGTSFTQWTLPIGSGTNLPSGTFTNGDTWRIIPCVCDLPTSLSERTYGCWYGLGSTLSDDLADNKFVALFPDAPFRFKRTNEAEQLAQQMRFALNVSQSGCTDYSANATFNVEITAPASKAVYISAYIIINNGDESSTGVIHDRTVNPYTSLTAGEMYTLPSSTTLYSEHWTSTDIDRAQISVYIVICNKQYDTSDGAALAYRSLFWDSKTSCDGAGHGTIEIKPVSTT